VRRGGGTALDPQVVSGLLADPDQAAPLRSLSPRERSVLALVAEGRSNKSIAERLSITQGAVQKHLSTIYNKLGLPAGEHDDRRILAVLACVRPGSGGAPGHTRSTPPTP
jgi:DNA-binding NarL/FixJ family response regulator